MLEKYKNVQPVAYQIIMNEVNNNKYSHAYIIETNGYHDGLSFAIDMAKTLFCINQKESQNIIDLIDSGNFPEFKIIDPEGLTIKKEDIEDLQYEFSKKPIYSDKKIYIINKADRLNSSSSNALLKFLEEPNQDIVAILIVNSIYELMETIISRCQLISLREETFDLTKLNLNERILFALDKNEEDVKLIFDNIDVNLLINKTIEFISYYENHNLDTFIYLNKIWFEYYNTKEQFDIGYKIMILYYTDVLRLLCNANVKIFLENQNDMEKIIQVSSLQNISSKIKILMELSKKIKQNNNLSLIMDKLLIEFGRCDGFV